MKKLIVLAVVVLFATVAFGETLVAPFFNDKGTEDPTEVLVQTALAICNLSASSGLVVIEYISSRPELGILATPAAHSFEIEAYETIVWFPGYRDAGNSPNETSNAAKVPNPIDTDGVTTYYHGDDGDPPGEGSQGSVKMFTLDTNLELHGTVFLFNSGLGGAQMGQTLMIEG